jgi:hypothetical protein
MDRGRWPPRSPIVTSITVLQWEAVPPNSHRFDGPLEDLKMNRETVIPMKLLFHELRERLGIEDREDSERSQNQKEALIFLEKWMHSNVSNMTSRKCGQECKKQNGHRCGLNARGVPAKMAKAIAAIMEVTTQCLFSPLQGVNLSRTYLITTNNSMAGIGPIEEPRHDRPMIWCAPVKDVRKFMD